MGANTKIQWTDHTFNPWKGCTKVSPGCKFCYAEREADHRFGQVKWGKGQARIRTAESNWRKPLAWNRQAAKEGTRPRVFCASWADWLDPEVPAEWLANLLNLIHATPNLDWQLLTKRPEVWYPAITDALEITREREGDSARMLHLWCNGIPPKNVWIGWTAEDQKHYELRRDHGLSIPARFHFVSGEPLIGPIEGADLTYIDWMIVGGESGSDRVMDPAWARSIRDQCKEAKVPFFMKQMGGMRPPFPEIPDDLMIREFPVEAPF